MLHTRFIACAVLPLGFLSVACGATDDGTGSEDMTPVGPGDPMQPGNPGTPPVGAEPGGGGSGGGPSVPPPSDNVCGIESGFAGDHLCIGAPDPTEGIHLHVGPSDYDDPDAVEPFVLEPGGENVVCYNARPSDNDFYYFNQQNRMRPSSHHMILRVVNDAGQPENGPCENLQGVLGGIPGSQTPSRDIPEGPVAPENQGLGRYMPPDALVQFELHYVNTQEEPVLREAWVNLFYKPAEEVEDVLQGISLIGGLGMNIPPHSRQVLNQSCEVTAESRVYELFGHFHANTERFSAWRIRQGERERLYESYNWSEPRTLVYDTMTTNPDPDAQRGIDGGRSGLLDFLPGDRIEWECDVNNTLDTPIRFANEAYTAEMCILFGAQVSSAGGFRCFQF